ncbi:hypothetical protein [Salibacterium qingdaonense]|uniref:Uncharacterized protein n=1 Tax=Salibacterium qingdaonense TaxID=266892 RepID=A0A1I4KQM9_9BACI|nr:hypothetical protein [Salibacterium qingdaonense]SFL80849.1 hypothetical protein SAMN04488054_105156 [Salibacterium qingdaonense]
MKKVIEKLFKGDKEKTQVFRSIFTILAGIAAAIKQVLEATFGLAIPSETVDAWVDLASWAVILFAMYRNNYFGEKGLSQLKLLINSGLE